MSANTNTSTTSNTSFVPNTYKDLWSFDLNDTGDVQHKVRIVRINNRSDNIAITRFNFVPQLSRYWPTGYQYFIPIEHWPKLQLAIDSLAPVANALYAEYLASNGLPAAEGAG